MEPAKWSLSNPRTDPTEVFVCAPPVPATKHEQETEPLKRSPKALNSKTFNPKTLSRKP